MELDLAGLSFRKSERYKKRFRRALPGPGEPLAEDLLCARGERRLAPGVRDLLHDLRLGRIGVNRAGDGLQAQARIHEHRELIDHVARMVCDDGRAEYLVGSLLDMRPREALVLAVEDGSVHFIELEGERVHLEALGLGVCFVYDVM